MFDAVFFDDVMSLYSPRVSFSSVNEEFSYHSVSELNSAFLSIKPCAFLKGNASIM